MHTHTHTHISVKVFLHYRIGEETNFLPSLHISHSGERQQRSWHGARWAKGAPEQNSKEYLQNFCVLGGKRNVNDLSESVPASQDSWSTCLFPVETDPLGVQRKACWSIAGVEAKLTPPPGIKATFIEIYREPCCNRWQLYHRAGEFMCWWEKVGSVSFISSPEWNVSNAAMGWLPIRYI